MSHEKDLLITDLRQTFNYKRVNAAKGAYFKLSIWGTSCLPFLIND